MALGCVLVIAAAVLAAEGARDMRPHADLRERLSDAEAARARAVRACGAYAVGLMFLGEREDEALSHRCNAVFGTEAAPTPARTPAPDPAPGISL